MGTFLLTDAFAQVKVITPSDWQKEDQVEVVHMTVSPAAEPAPSLKYRFLVPAADQIHSNAATYVYKSMIFESPDYINEINQLDNDDTVVKWLDTPLDQLPRDEILQKVHWLSEKSQWQSLCEAARCD